MKKRVLIFLTTVFLLILIGPGIGQQRDHDRIQMKDKMVNVLNLTDEQQVKIDEIRLNNQKEMIDLKADLQKKKIGLKELLQKGNYSRAEYISRTDGIISANNKIEIARAEHQMDIYESLDADQQKIWNKNVIRSQGKRDKFIRKEFRRFDHY